MSLLRRTFSAILLLSGAAIILFKLPSIIGASILFLMAVVCMLEFYNMLKTANIPTFKILGTVAGILLLASSYFALNVSFFLGEHHRIDVWKELPFLMLTLIGFTIYLRQFPQKNNTQPLATISGTVLGLVYVPLLMVFLFLLAFHWTPVSPMSTMSPTAAWLLVYLVVVVKSSDVGAYFTGSLIGRHKLIPRISPGKTWEGLAGGLATGILTSVLFARLFHVPGSEPGTFTFGCIVLDTFDVCFLSAVGVLGDLFESLLKRSAGMKDSGCIFPGMGGLLDVLDSLLFAAPALYFYLRWFAHVA
jgi:phosphatidate cytidylyltransferase